MLAALSQAGHWLLVLAASDWLGRPPSLGVVSLPAAPVPLEQREQRELAPVLLVPVLPCLLCLAVLLVGLVVLPPVPSTLWEAWRP